MNRSHYKPARNRESGIALVEIMVAMLIGLFLLGGIVQVFASSRYTYRVHEAASRMQESGRMALEVIGRDVRMADFWGCASKTNNVTNNLDPAGVGFIDFDAGGIDGTEGGPGVPDTLVLRGGFNLGFNVQPPYGPMSSANIKVPAGNDLEQGDLVFVADCESADIFQVTNANPSAAGVLVHNTGAAVEPGNFNVTDPGCPGANAHCLSKIYGSDASVFATREITYTVGVGAEGQPALFRNGLEYLDGVEDLQILYGEDTDPPGSAGSGVANYYVPANQVIDMATVVSIRFSVVTRSYNDNLTDVGIAQNFSVLGEDRVAPDRRLRQVYTSTVAVRNRL